jgi:two-component system, response regulator PdtaR
MMPLENHILVVDDEFLIVEGLCAQIEDCGWKVCGTASTADTAVALAQEHRPIIVLMDMRLRGQGDGVDAALAIHDTVGSKVIFITGSREPETMKRIQLDHPSAVLFKPITFRQLQATIEAAMHAQLPGS